MVAARHSSADAVYVGRARACGPPPATVGGGEPRALIRLAASARRPHTSAANLAACAVPGHMVAGRRRNFIQRRQRELGPHSAKYADGSPGLHRSC